MQNVTFSQFRNKAKNYFDAVEAGESVEIFRHGKPVAILSPVRHHADYWKTVKPLVLHGLSLSQTILDERDTDSA